MAAAIELFDERGYDQTTVADIAERAGLTKRTFFRHFADKREVLFSNGEDFQAAFVTGLADAPAETPPLEAVGIALEAGGALLADRRPFARRRQAIILANPELQERERAKLASVAEALAEGLRSRGVPEPAASLAAQTGLAVFHVAFERWTTGEDERELVEVIRESLEALRAVAAA